MAEPPKPRAPLSRASSELPTRPPSRGSAATGHDVPAETPPSAPAANPLVPGPVPEPPHTDPLAVPPFDEATNAGLGPAEILRGVDVEAMVRTLGPDDPRRFLLAALMGQPAETFGAEGEATAAGKRRPVPRTRPQEVIQAILKRAAAEFDAAVRTASVPPQSGPTHVVARRRAAVQALREAAREFQPKDETGTALWVVQHSMGALAGLEQRALDFEANMSTESADTLEPELPPVRPKHTLMHEMAHAQLAVVLGHASGLDDGKRLHKLLDKMLERRAVGGAPTAAQVEVFKEQLALCTQRQVTGVEADRVLQNLLGGKPSEPVIKAGGKGALPLPPPLENADRASARPNPVRAMSDTRFQTLQDAPAREEPTLTTGPRPFSDASTPKTAPSGELDQEVTPRPRRRPTGTAHPVNHPRPMSAEQLRAEARLRLDRMLPADVSPFARERLLSILDRFAEARAVGASVLDPTVAVAELLSALQTAAGRKMSARDADPLFSLLGLEWPR